LTGPVRSSATHKFLIFGAGAIGTYLGGSLALHGFPVVFLVRPETAVHLEERGLRLVSNDRERRVEQPLLATTIQQALALGPFQAAIFALKSFDTWAAAQALAPHAARMPPVLCLQNGVENEATLAESLGKEKVIAGTVTSAVGRRAPGDIVLERSRGVGLADGHAISGDLREVFNKAGLNAHLYRNAASMKWSKLLTNLLANATSAILNMNPAQVFAHPGLYRIEVEQLREALRVMAASNLPVVDLPGTPVRALAFTARGLPLSLSRPFLRQAISGGRGGKMPSFHIDLHSGRGITEVDYLNGAVVRAGAILGIPAPVNHVLAELLTALARGEYSIDRFAHQPELLLHEIQERGSRNP
jgi:2-dehydropantoate 2-reductase